MNRLKSPKLFLSIPMILIIIFFFVRDLVSKHHKIHNLVFSTYEFIIRADRAAVFAVFYVIVMMVFLGSSKPSSAEDFDDVFFLPPPPPVVQEVYSTEKEEENNEEYYESDDDKEEERDEYHGYDGYDEDNDDDLDEDDVDSEDEIYDIDLEKRIDEFIAKVYKIRGEELLAERLLWLQPLN